MQLGPKYVEAIGMVKLHGRKAQISHHHHHNNNNDNNNDNDNNDNNSNNNININHCCSYN